MCFAGWVSLGSHASSRVRGFWAAWERGEKEEGERNGHIFLALPVHVVIISHWKAGYGIEEEAGELSYVTRHKEKHDV